jgi:hypothetical protein
MRRPSGTHLEPYALKHIGDLTLEHWTHGCHVVYPVHGNASHIYVDYGATIAVCSAALKVRQPRHERLGQNQFTRSYRGERLTWGWPHNLATLGIRWRPIAASTSSVLAFGLTLAVANFVAHANHGLSFVIGINDFA